jgi:hypothetical protein
MTMLRTLREQTAPLLRPMNMRFSLRGSFLVGMGFLLVCYPFERTSRAAEAPLVAEARVPVVSTPPIATEPSSDSVEWSVSGAAGPVLVGLAAPSAGPWPPSFGVTSTAWQVELQRRRKDERFIAGVTLEGTYDHDKNSAGQQLLGVDAFIGTTWRYRHWTLETTIGAGIEAAQIFQVNPVSAFYETFDFINPSYELGLYIQGTLAVAVPLSNAIEVLLKFGVHLTEAHDENWFAAGTIGLRYRLP